MCIIFEIMTKYVMLFICVFIVCARVCVHVYMCLSVYACACVPHYSIVCHVYHSICAQPEQRATC